MGLRNGTQPGFYTDNNVHCIHYSISMRLQLQWPFRALALKMSRVQRTQTIWNPGIQHTCARAHTNTTFKTNPRCLTCVSSDLSEKVSAKDVNRRFIRELVHLFLIIKASAVAQVTNNSHEIKKQKT